MTDIRERRLDNLREATDENTKARLRIESAILRYQ